MEKNLKSLNSSFCKRKLRQNKGKITKTNKYQIKPKQNKPELNAKQPVKTMKENLLWKKERDVVKQEWTYPVCKWVWKETQIDWIVCGICSVCEYEDFVLCIYNTWCEIIQT